MESREGLGGKGQRARRRFEGKNQLKSEGWSQKGEGEEKCQGKGEQGDGRNSEERRSIRRKGGNEGEECREVISKGNWETMGEDEWNWGSKGRRGGSKKGKWE